MTICRHHTTFDAIAHMTPIFFACFTLSYVKVLVGVLYFVLCKSLSWCALLSKKVYFTLSYVQVLVGVLYFLKRCVLLSQSMYLFVDYNHSRGPVLNDFLYKAPSASVVGRS